MALSPSAPTSPLPRQLLRYVSSQLAAAFQFQRPAPTINLPASAPRAADAAAAPQQLRTAASRPAPSPKGRPGAPRQGSGGHVHAAPTMATTARVVMREPAPPGLPAQGSGGSGGKVHAVSPAATASVLARGPAPPGSPAEGSGGRGGSIHAVDS